MSFGSEENSSFSIGCQVKVRAVRGVFFCLVEATFLLRFLDAGVDSWRLASDSADRALRDERACLGQTSSV